MSERNTICLLVGASGSGKTTVANKLFELYGLTQIDSYTTRPKRSDSEVGHTFVSDDAFDRLSDFVGYTEYNGYRYAATAAQVEANDVYVIDPAGVQYFRESYHGGKRVVVVHIDVDAEERVKRMRERGDNMSDIFRRLMNDLSAFKTVDADFVLKNSVSPDACAQEIYRKVFQNDSDIERNLKKRSDES